MTAMEARVQRVLVWAGPAMLVIWVGAFLFVARFFPPSHPAASAQEIVRMYVDHNAAIKIGMVITMMGSALLVPYGFAISGQVKRIDGGRALADIQAVSCALLSLEFITPIAVWMSVAYRVDGRSADTTRALHDLGWILFMTVIWSLFVQLVAIAAAVFLDRGSRAVFPRWIGYLNLWVAVLIIPAGLVLFFKHGPFAWNGVVGLYIPLTAFTFWVFAMTWAVHRNLSEQIASGGEPADTGSRADVLTC